MHKDVDLNAIKTNYLSQMRSQQSYQGAICPKTISEAIESFKTLEMQNRQLLQLANQVQRSPFMIPPPPIIYRFQDQLRRNLTIFIDSVRQVFVDMDNRFRALAKVIDSVHFSMAIPKIAHFYPNSDQYQNLKQRISSLELNLTYTQQNEAKLIATIERLERREQLEGRYEQASKIRRKGSRQYFSNCRPGSSDSQQSLRLFSLRAQNSLKKSQNRPINEQGQIEIKKETEPFSFTCFGQTQSENGGGMEPQRNAVDCEKNYASTHTHRLHFMMHALKS